MKNAKMVPLEQNRRLPVGCRKSIQESFCVSWWTLYAYQISFAYDKVGGGAAILSHGHAHFRKIQIPTFFSEPDMCAKFHDFSWSFRPPKMHLFRKKKKE